MESYSSMASRSTTGYRSNILPWDQQAMHRINEKYSSYSTGWLTDELIYRNNGFPECEG